MLKSTFEGEEIIHRMLWGIVKEQAKEALEREEGWFNPSVVARVFAYNTVEATMSVSALRRRYGRTSGTTSEKSPIGGH